MEERRDDTDRMPGYPGDTFRDLIDRPTPELDSSRLWRRIEGHLSPRSRTRRIGPIAARGVRPGMFGWGAIALAAAALVVWFAVAWQAPVRGGEIVLLTTEQPDGGVLPRARVAGDDAQDGVGVTAPGEERLALDVRLVRGYDGATPADVGVAEAMGVGGADALLDARANIERLLPFESFGVVGVGRSELDDGAALEIDLSDDYRLIARSVETVGTPRATVRIEGIELEGRGQEARPFDLSIEPGRLYILGVLAPAAEHPELVLLIRAQAARTGSR